MKNIEKLLLQILESQNKTNERLSMLEQKVDRIESKLDAVYNQTARTCEDVTIIKDEVVKGQEAYNFVQGIKSMFVK